MEKGLEKISLSRCRKVLESDGSKYTDEEVLMIRDFLYRLAEMEYEVFLKKKEREIELEKRMAENEEEENLKQAA